MTNPSRLFIDSGQITPANTFLSFTSETAVANYYGVGSRAAILASQYFDNGLYNGIATMEFQREDLGQRPHLIGANLSSYTLAQLQSISGSISLTFGGWAYSADINLAGVTSFPDAANVIMTALNANRQVAATLTEASIAPVSVPFYAYASGAQLWVTTAAPGSIQIGSIISGPNVVPGTQIIDQHSGVPGGPGYYTTFKTIPISGTIPSSELMTESYGVLNQGTVTSGLVNMGQAVNGPGISTHTSIVGSNGVDWLVDNAQTFSGDITMRAAPLQINGNEVAGLTENRDWLSVQPNGYFGYDAYPSSMSFASGTAADALGLTQTSGAIDSSPGGQHPSVGKMMNDIVTKEGAQFDSLQNVGNYFLTPAMETWAAQNGYTFLNLADNVTTPAYGSGMLAGGELLLPPVPSSSTHFDGEFSRGGEWGVAANSSSLTSFGR